MPTVGSLLETFFLLEPTRDFLLNRFQRPSRFDSLTFSYFANRPSHTLVTLSKKVYLVQTWCYLPRKTGRLICWTIFRSLPPSHRLATQHTPKFPRTWCTCERGYLPKIFLYIYSLSGGSQKENKLPVVSISDAIR